MTLSMALGVTGGLLITVLVSVLVYFTVRVEEKPLFYIVLIFSLLQPAYVIFELYRVSTCIN